MRRLFRAMGRMWWLYAAALAVFMGMAAIYASLRMPVWRAHSQMLIEDSTPDIGGKMSGSAGVVARMFSFGGGLGSMSVTNETQLIGSHDLLLRTVKALDLNRVSIRHDGLSREALMADETPVTVTMAPGAADTLGTTLTVGVKVHADGKADITVSKGWRLSKKTLAESHEAGLPASIATPYGELTVSKGPGYKQGEAVDVDVKLSSYEAAANALSYQVTVDVADKLGDVIALDAEAPSARWACRILDEMMAQYNRRRVERRRENAAEEVRFYDARIEELFGELTENEAELEQFKIKNNIADMGQEVTALAGRVLDESGTFAAKRLMLTYFENVKSMLEADKDNLTLIPAGEGKNPLIESYNELVLRKQVLARSAKENNPVMADLNGQINGLKQTVIKYLDEQLKQGRLELASLESLSGEAHGRIGKLQRLEREARTLNRDHGIKNELFLVLVQQREAARMRYNSSSTAGFIMDPAYADAKPSMKRTYMAIMAALLLTLIVPTVLIVAWMRMRDRVEGPEDMASMDLESRTVKVIPEKGEGTTALRAMIPAGAVTIYAANFADREGSDVVSDMADALERIGRKTGHVHHPERNDDILHPDMKEQLRPGEVNIVMVPDVEHMGGIAEAVNKEGSLLLAVVKCGESKRRDLRAYLAGIERTHVAVAIVCKA